MKLRDYLRTRRQKKARAQYEREKARNEAANDPATMERVVERAKNYGSGIGGVGGGS